MNIDSKLEREIVEYCNLNDLKIDDYINNLLKNAFLLDKYGERPEILIKKEKPKTKTTKKKPTVVVEPNITTIVVETDKKKVEKKVDLESKQEIIEVNEPKKRNRRKLS